MNHRKIRLTNDQKIVTTSKNEEQNSSRGSIVPNIRLTIPEINLKCDHGCFDTLSNTKLL